jgi:hypothetical protein
VRKKTRKHRSRRKRKEEKDLTVLGYGQANHIELVQGNVKYRAFVRT